MSDMLPKILGAATGLAGIYGYLNPNDPKPVGFQGSIPQYTAIRDVVPGTNDPDRRPGSSGQRYFTDIQYEPQFEQQMMSPEQLQALNQWASDLYADLGLNNQTPLGEAPEAPEQTPIGEMPTSGQTALPEVPTRNQEELNEQIRDYVTSVVEQFGGMTPEAQFIIAQQMRINNISPEQMAEATGYPLEDIVAAYESFSFKEGGLVDLREGYEGRDDTLLNETMDVLGDPQTPKTTAAPTGGDFLSDPTQTDFVGDPNAQMTTMGTGDNLPDFVAPEHTLSEQDINTLTTFINDVVAHYGALTQDAIDYIIPAFENFGADPQMFTELTGYDFSSPQEAPAVEQRNYHDEIAEYFRSVIAHFGGVSPEAQGMIDEIGDMFGLDGDELGQLVERAMGKVDLSPTTRPLSEQDVNTLTTFINDVVAHYGALTQDAIDYITPVLEDFGADPQMFAELTGHDFSSPQEAPVVEQPDYTDAINSYIQSVIGHYGGLTQEALELIEDVMEEFGLDGDQIKQMTGVNVGGELYDPEPARQEYFGRVGNYLNSVINHFGGPTMDAQRMIFETMRDHGLTPEQVSEMIRYSVESIRNAYENFSFKSGGRVYSQGGYLDGATDGMADEVPATINGKQPAAMADGEFVIPADVVSHLGNGNSNAGAKALYDMLARVRKERTGTAKQGREIRPEQLLPR